MIIWIMIWIIQAGCIAGVAELKGRSVSGWFILGILLGTLALLIIVIIPSKQDEGYRR